MILIISSDVLNILKDYFIHDMAIMFYNFSVVYVCHSYLFLVVLISYGKIIILLLLLSLVFFASVLLEGHTLEFELQQVYISLQKSSLYSGHSQQCCSLDGLHSSSNSPVLQTLYNPLVTVPKRPIIIGIIVTFMFHSSFQFPNKVEIQNPIGFYVSFSRTDAVLCIYHTEISISCTSSSGSPYPPDGLSQGSEWQQDPQVSKTFLNILADLSNAVI